MQSTNWMLDLMGTVHAGSFMESYCQINNTIDVFTTESVLFSCGGGGCQEQIAVSNCNMKDDIAR